MLINYIVAVLKFSRQCS